MSVWSSLLVLITFREVACASQTFYSGIEVYPTVLNSCKPFEGFQLTFNDAWIGQNGFNYTQYASDKYNVSPFLFFLQRYDQGTPVFNKFCLNNNCVTKISDYIAWNPSSTTNTTLRTYYDSAYYNPFQLVSTSGTVKFMDSVKQNYYFFSYTLTSRPSLVKGTLSLEKPISGAKGYYSFSFVHPCIYIPENTVVEFKRPLILNTSINEFGQKSCEGMVRGSSIIPLTCNYTDTSVFIYNLFNTTYRDITYASKNIEIRIFGLNAPFPHTQSYKLFFYSAEPIDYNNFLQAEFSLPSVLLPPIVLKNYSVTSMTSTTVAFTLSIATDTLLNTIVGNYFYITFPTTLPSFNLIKVNITQNNDLPASQTENVTYNGTSRMLLNTIFKLDKGVTITISGFGKGSFTGAGNVKFGFLDTSQAPITQEYSYLMQFY